MSTDSTAQAAPAPAYLVRGSDPSLRADALDRLLSELLAGEDRSLAVEDLTVPGGRAAAEGDGDGGEDGDDDAVAAAAAGTGDELPATAAGALVGAALDAAATPPFMTARRVVVLRDVGNLGAAEAGPIAAYLADPMPTTVLVLVAGGGGAGRPAAGPRALGTALTKAGAITVGPDTEATADVLGTVASEVGITLRGAARAAVLDRLGEDAARVRTLVEALAAAHGEGARLDSAADVEPYLGEAGAVPAYLLTNAVESGDVPTALEVLHRVLHATSSRQPRAAHPLQVMAMLHNRYRRLLRLDDPTIRSPEEAAAVLSSVGKSKVSPGAARHALTAARALGTEGLREAFGHLHHADLALKGASGVPGETVLEVLVVRLATLSARAGSAGRRSRPAGVSRR